MTEINDVTSLTKSVNRIAKAMNQDFSKESLTDSLDAIADYIEENGMGGGSGETVNPLEITITRNIDEGTISANKEYSNFFGEFNQLAEELNADGARVPCTITHHVIEDGEDLGDTKHGFVVRSSAEDSDDGGALMIVLYYEYRFVYDDNIYTINEKVLQGYLIYSNHGSNIIEHIHG